MLDSIKQYFASLKTKRVLRKAASILTKLNYDLLDSDPSTIAFRLDKDDSVALFVAEESTLGHRLEATVLFKAEILNLKLMSDIAMLAYANRCASSGVVHSGNGRARLELSFYLGDSFTRSEIAIGLTYLTQCIRSIGERLISKSNSVSTFKFDLSMFDDEKIPFFDPQLVGERKEFAHGTWDAYIQSVANQQAIASFSADVDYNLEVILACRDFEAINNAPLVEVGDAVMIELARHRNNKASKEDKADIQ